MSRAKDNRLPVTILTGFLGSGKTTLLNHILYEKHNLKLAIIENEFGEVGVDDLLLQDRKKRPSDKKSDKEAKTLVVEQTNEEVVEMMNGCVCCTVRKDLILVVKKILSMKKKFDGIIIETTGLADPAPVAQTFFVDEDIAEKCVLDAIITVVDIHNIITRLDEEREEGVEAVEQVAFADKIILNKMDLMKDRAQIDEIKRRISVINSHAQMIESTNSVVDPNLLFKINGFDINKIFEKEPDFLEPDSQDHKHDASVTSVSFETEDAMSVGDLNEWIGTLIKGKGTDLFRYKGVINTKGMDQKFVFQGVHMLFRGEFGAPWKKNEKRFSRFVFIGRNIDHAKLKADFLKCKAPGTLRFKIGDLVEARISETKYEKGRILKTWDEGNPYRIELEDGKRTNVWGPSDVDALVRARQR